MKKRVLIAITVIILIGISYFGLQMFKIESEKKALDNTIYKGDIEFAKQDLNQATELKNGRWRITTDSLAGFEIENGKLIMFSGSQKIDSNGIYDFKISTSYLEELSMHSQPIEFLFLTNKTDSIDYLILGSSERKVSLIQIPDGEKHVYIME